jgi:hypothetical protein
MLKRRIKKLTKAQASRITGTKLLICRECSNEEVTVPADTASVVCSYCVMKWVGAPPAPKPKSDKPRGWHFKKYFEHGGVVYSMGEVISDLKQIAQLKREHKKDAKTKTTVKKKTVVKKPKSKTNARTSR